MQVFSPRDLPPQGPCCSRLDGGMRAIACKFFQPVSFSVQLDSWPHPAIALLRSLCLAGQERPPSGDGPRQGGVHGRCPLLQECGAAGQSLLYLERHHAVSATPFDSWREAHRSTACVIAALLRPAVSQVHFHNVSVECLDCKTQLVAEERRLRLQRTVENRWRRLAVLGQLRNALPASFTHCDHLRAF